MDSDSRPAIGYAFTKLPTDARTTSNTVYGVNITFPAPLALNCPEQPTDKEEHGFVVSRDTHRAREAARSSPDKPSLFVNHSVPDTCRCAIGSQVANVQRA
ncbi:hypothetical protein BaRGS_00005306 [Batillaria attramentaria]|uniref:Uncharacterized protein n=1 Tax=Batillaria attramentaria TaxID=370345 RepID=A0ABD0LW57_9CAEN